MFDRNKDGYVVADEIKYVMKKLGHKLSDKDVEEIIRRGDENSDGKLDYRGNSDFLSWGLLVRKELLP